MSYDDYSKMDAQKDGQDDRKLRAAILQIEREGISEAKRQYLIEVIQAARMP